MVIADCHRLWQLRQWLEFDGGEGFYGVGVIDQPLGALRLSIAQRTANDIRATEAP
jgi:hypothetical protein